MMLRERMRETDMRIPPLDEIAPGKFSGSCTKPASKSVKQPVGGSI